MLLLLWLICSASASASASVNREGVVCKCGLLREQNLDVIAAEHLRAHCETTVARMLVGNKCDLEDLRAVSLEEGKNLAEEEGLFFMETSALNATNVQTAFEIVIREIYNNVSRKVLSSDSYKAELSVNRVSLVKNGADSKSRMNLSCCGG